MLLYLVNTIDKSITSVEAEDDALGYEPINGNEGLFFSYAAARLFLADYLYQKCIEANRAYLDCTAEYYEFCNKYPYSTE